MNYYALMDLRREPFSNSPDPDFFYDSPQHLECLQQLEISVRLRRGLNLVTGRVGTGKTTICRQLIRLLALDLRIKTCLVLDPSFAGPRELLAELAFMLTGEHPAEGSPAAGLKERIKDALFTLGVDQGRLVTLLIDEGQKLHPECLETLRELLNYETNEHKLLQIVIFAQAEIEAEIAARENFADRINLHYRLGPLDLADMRRMILYRLAKAAGDQGGEAEDGASEDGAARPRFTEEAFAALHEATGGYPRKVVKSCHKLMLAAIIAKTPAITGELVRRECAALPEPCAAAPRRRRVSPVRVLGGAAAAAGLVMALAWQPLAADLGRRLTGMETAAATISNTVSGLMARLPADGAAIAAPVAVTDPVKAATIAAAPAAPLQDSRLLGTVRSAAGESLADVARLAFGADAPSALEALREANPQLPAYGPLAEGTPVALPRPGDLADVQADGYGVSLGEFPSLDEALDVLRQSHGRLGLQLAFSEDGQGGAAIQVVSARAFANADRLYEELARLPEGLNGRASIVWGLRSKRLSVEGRQAAGVRG